MPPSDHDLVNFDQDYELNYILKVYGKSQSEENRTFLKEEGGKAKKDLGKTSSQRITHKEFYTHLEKKCGWKKAKSL